MTTTALLYITAGAIATPGLVLLAWSLFSDHARGRKRCPKCWYDMGGAEPSPDLTCPECGRAITTERELRRTRRKWRCALSAAAIIAIAPLTLVIIKPTHPTLLALAYPILDREAKDDAFKRLAELTKPTKTRAGNTAYAGALTEHQKRLVARVCAHRLGDSSVPYTYRELPHGFSGRAEWDVLAVLWRIGPTAKCVQPDLVRMAAEPGRPTTEIWQLAAIALPLASDEETARRQRRAIAENAVERSIHLAIAISCSFTIQVEGEPVVIPRDLTILAQRIKDMSRETRVQFIPRLSECIIEFDDDLPPAEPLRLSELIDPLRRAGVPEPELEELKRAAAAYFWDDP
jgi:hypothetical protein